MKDLIDARSGRTSIDTYSAFQSVKYHLKAKGKTAKETFHCIKSHPKVHKKVGVALRSAYKVHKLRLEELQQQRQQRKEALKMKDAAIESKKNAKAKIELTEKLARLAHKRQMKKKLECLVQKRKKDKKKKSNVKN